MTKAELVIKVTLAADGELTRARSAQLVDAVFHEIRQAVIETGRYTHLDFGRWSTRRRAERRGVHPRTRAPVVFGASRTVTFHPAPALKGRLGARKV